MKKIISMVLLIAITFSTQATMFSEFVNTHATKIGFFGLIAVIGAYVVRIEKKLKKQAEQIDDFSKNYVKSDQLPNYLKKEEFGATLQSNTIFTSHQDQLTTQKNKINEMIDSAALIFHAEKGLVPLLNQINNKLEIESTGSKLILQNLTETLNKDKILSKLP